MTELPAVKELVTTEILGHQFCFRRLHWTDMAKVTGWVQAHRMDERLAMIALALQSVSGVSMTSDSSFKVLTTLPKAALFQLFRFYKGSLDLHRMFDAPVLYSAPDAVTYQRRLFEETEVEENKEDELEEFLAQKFGRQEVEEQMELGRQMAASSKYAGAVKQEQTYLDATVKRLNEEEDW